MERCLPPSATRSRNARHRECSRLAEALSRLVCDEYSLRMERLNAGNLSRAPRFAVTGYFTMMETLFDATPFATTTIVDDPVSAVVGTVNVQETTVLPV